MTTLLVIGVVGLVLLAVSLVVGDLFDGALDALDGLAGDVFSSAVIGAFVSAFGFGGAAAAGAGLPGVVTVPVGIASGVVFAWFAVWLTRLVKDGGSDATPTLDATVGRDAEVVTGIPAEGYGVVVVRLGGHTMRLNARSAVARALETGTPVHVTEVISPSAVAVSPTWQLDAGDPDR